MVKTQLIGKTRIEAGVSSGDIVVGPCDADEIQLINLYSKTIENITQTNLKLTLEISPDGKDDVWVESDLELVPSDTADEVMAASGLDDLIGRRARVKISFDAFSDGSFDLYLLGRSN